MNKKTNIDTELESIIAIIFLFIFFWVLFSFTAAVLIFAIFFAARMIIIEVRKDINTKKVNQLSQQHQIQNLHSESYIHNNDDVTIKYAKHLIPFEYHHLHLIDFECRVRTGKYVEKDDLLYTLSLGISITDFEPLVDVELYCVKSGFIEIHTKDYSHNLNYGEILYSIYNNSESVEKLFQEYFAECEPIISKDNFLNTKDLKWSRIPGSSIINDFETKNKFCDCIQLCNDGYKSELLFFTLNCLENKDYIIFKNLRKYLKLKKGDKIQFLLDNKDIVEFEIPDNIYNNLEYDGDKVYASTVPITTNELELLANYNITNWKIQFIDGSDKIISKKDGYLKSLQFSIRTFFNHYINTVKMEINSHIPFSDSINSKSVGSENQRCYIYLMIDTSTDYHKIGISNKPDYREKTLQSEKPTIEMIASREYPNRKIAYSFEQALHSTYKDKRIRGEWFDLNQDDVNDIITSLS